MSNKRPLVPSFLNRLDNRLLLNKPDVWSTRAHLVLYYSLLFIAVLTIVSFVIPDDPRSDSPIFYWVGFVIVLSILALTVWLIYLLRFNVFKRYGKMGQWSRLSVFGLYFLSVGMIALFPLVMPFVESIRANNAYSGKEITDDINAMNVKICQLEYDSLSHALKTDTLLVVDTVPQYRSMPDQTDDAADDTAVIAYPNYRLHFKMTDTSSLKMQLANADSSHQLNDSMYLLFKASDYTFVSPYQGELHGKLFTDFDLYNRIIRNFQLVNRKQTRSELYALLNKYKLTKNEETTYDYYDNEPISNRINKRYDISFVNRSLTNIIQRKDRWDDENLSSIIRFWFYSALLTTLLVFIFRHTTKRAFFLSLLVGVVLTIFTSLTIAYFGKSQSSFFIWLIAYTILFFAISLFAFQSKIRRVAVGIGINFFVLMIVFLPTFIVGYYYERLLRKDMEKVNFAYFDYETMYRYLLYAEIAGPILLLILLATYIQRLYRQWYALPEE